MDFFSKYLGLQTFSSPAQPLHLFMTQKLYVCLCVSVCMFLNKIIIRLHYLCFIQAKALSPFRHTAPGEGHVSYLHSSGEHAMST